MCLRPPLRTKAAPTPTSGTRHSTWELPKPKNGAFSIPGGEAKGSVIRVRSSLGGHGRARSTVFYPFLPNRSDSPDRVRTPSLSPFLLV